MGGIEIRGEGVAAACCAYVLGRGGFRISRVRGTRARVPAIVVSRGTQALIEDVFETEGLFAGCPQVERRTVGWGRGEQAVTLPHAAVVIGEGELLARIEEQAPRARRISDGTGPESGSGSPQWTVFASRPLPEGVVERHFGTRRATAVAVELKMPDGTACWTESLEGGWLFLIPGWLIAVGGEPETLLAESRLVAEQIRRVGRERAEFPSYPTMADPVCGAEWLACGSAAMAFDPMCGDGTGNAVRGAILTAAVIRAAARGESVERLRAHYGSRLMAAFRKHLDVSLEFYRRGHGGPWWDVEIAALERGVRWCAHELAGSPDFQALGFRYRLQGFDLLPV